MRRDKQIARLVGDLGEILAKQALEGEGYRIERFDGCNAELCYNRCGWYSRIIPLPDSQTTLEEHIKPFSDFKYPSNCRRGEKWIKLMKHRDKLVSRYSSYRGSNLDFYATKDNKEYVIEIKTNKAVLEKSQKELIEYAKELGYIPILVRSRVSGKVTKTKEL